LFSQVLNMRALRFCLLAATILLFTGCTEMRVEGDAKIFQTSAVGSIIRTVIGLGLVGLGAGALVASVLPDRKPRNRIVTPKDKLSSGQRTGLALFGFAMGFMGVFLAGISLLFPSKLHVTVYPDRVAMASTYSQTGGKEVVIPFANLSSIELRNEPNVVGKLQAYLVFTHTNGNVIKQDAGNNERQAVDTIRKALADYQSQPPVIVGTSNVAINATPPLGGAVSSRLSESRTSSVTERTDSTPSSTTPPTSSSQQYSLKRYKISIPVPSDHTIVGPDTVVAVGMKLRACYAGYWSPVTVVAINDDGTITCNWDSWPTYTYKMMREDLTIQVPNGSAAPVDLPSTQYSLKRYEVNIPVPEGHSIVGADTVVKVGMKLGACYAGRWESVTVVAINEDGTVTCNWDKWPSFTYKMMREDLTIADDNAP
jgi:hypothetical protein